MEGPEVLDSVRQESPDLVPAELFPNGAEYWRRVDNAVRSHRAMLRGFGSSEEDQRLYSTQTLWDNSMGEACALALERHPDHRVVHVNGGFHSAYWDGTVRQFRLRNSTASVATVAIEPATLPAIVELPEVPVADYVVYAEARATDVSDGTWSVYVTRESEYRLHLPADLEQQDSWPLLMWLGDTGLRSQDGIELWKEQIGDEAIIAVLEPPYREVQPDLSEGGRWFWPDRFAGDVQTQVAAVRRTWGYLLRHYPVDSERVCVAGEGTGATVAAAVTVFAGDMSIHGCALQPRRYAKLKDFSLPLPEYRDRRPASRTLAVLGRLEEESWWGEELQEYREVGLATNFVVASDDVWSQEVHASNVVRTALGLAPQRLPAGAERAYLLLQEASPRARHWARMQALRCRLQQGKAVALLTEAPEEGSALPLPLEINAEAFARQGALPRCPGPFGGTTVLVIPEHTPADEAERWLALQDQDPLNAASRFHRLRVATAGGEKSLVATLTLLQSESRKNVLILPAEFCADAPSMRAYHKSVQHLEDQMTLQWLPGLGGRPIPAATPPATAEPDETTATIATESKAVATMGDPVRHRLHVALDPDRHELRFEDQLQLPAPLQGSGTEFTLSPALEILRSDPPVREVGREENGDVRYALQEAATAGWTLSCRGTFDFGLSDQKEEYTRGFRETRGIVGSEGVYLDGASCWLPKLADSMIEFSLQVEVPSDWHVISQGRGTSCNDEGVAVWESEGPLEQVYLVGGPLIVERDVAGAVETLVYLHEKDDALSRKYLDTTARYLEMYRGLIGPYPYAKFALVENFWETGYGMPSFTLLGPQVIRFPFILHSSYPHEILHNWWGNSVFVDWETGNWCEGLTAYMADHLVQEQRGQGQLYRRSTLQKYRDYVKEGRDFPLSEFRSRHSAATEAVGYGKALMTFHMLRRQGGDDAFRSALAGFYRKHRGRRASFADLQVAFEGVLEEDLADYFAQWVSRTGAPELALQDVRAHEEESGWQVHATLAQLQADPQPYQLEVRIEVQTEAGLETHRIPVSEVRESFTLQVQARPLQVAADPAFDLFRKLDPRETPPSIGQIFGESDILAVLPTEPADQVAGYQQLVDAWQSDEHQIRSLLESDLNELPATQAIWFLGRDNQQALRWFSRQTGLQLLEGGTGLRLAGEEVPFAGHCTVVMARHPSNVEKAIGWICVDPAAALSGLARKLPHYGKYSYLAFEGDEPSNTVKGQWPALHSPLVVDLRADRSVPLAAADQETRPALADLPPVFSQHKLREHVEWLAAPERQGRGLGSRGLQEAADYIAQAMVEIGLEPGGDGGGWLQKFSVESGPDGKPVQTANVVGLIRGSRTDWQEQSLVLSAHYDHLGFGWPDAHAEHRGKLHPGADDNASGVAVMLELARSLKAQGQPSRTLVVVAFAAEECGLLGSRFYTQQPQLPLAGIRGVINLDAVGRLGEGAIAIHGVDSADEWQHIFRGCGFVTGIASKNVQGSADGSDQFSFLQQGIPAVQIFSGAHADYHRPSDTADKIDGPGLVKVATFLKEAVVYMLEREEPLTVTIEGMAKQTPGHGTQAGRRVSFGTVPEFEFQGDGVKIASLVAGSPAEQAGLQPGDVLTQINGEALADLRAFSNILKKLTPGQTVAAVILRGGQTQEFEVTVVAR
jgi:hypothetical protein